MVDLYEGWLAFDDEKDGKVKNSKYNNVRK